MKKSEAIERAGGVGKLAKLVGLTSGAISQWGEDVPMHRVWQLRVIKPRWFRKPKPGPVDAAPGKDAIK